MSNRAAALLIAGIVAALLIKVATENSSTSTESASRTILPNSIEDPPQDHPRHYSPAQDKEAPNNETPPPPPTSNPFQAGESILIGEISAQLGLLAEKINLTPAERDQVCQTFIEFVQAKNEYEKTIIEFAAFKNGILELKIPKYPEVGNELQLRLWGKIAANIGEERATTMLSDLGNTFDVSMAKFGQADQYYSVRETFLSGEKMLIVKRVIASPTKEPTNFSDELDRSPNSSWQLTPNEVEGGSQGSIYTITKKYFPSL